MSRDRLAIVAGTGRLPQLLAEHCRDSGREYRVVSVAGFAPAWLGAHPAVAARLEKTGKLLADLREAGCNAVVFAGAMARPRLDPGEFDAGGALLAGSLARGDDSTLRSIAALFEAGRLQVLAAQDVLPDLLVPAGILGRIRPSPADREDAGRAAAIVAALGAADVGQGAVVARGLCLGLESVQGTDAMLEFVAATAARTGQSGGVLYKAAKPGQDRRFDLPAIGEATVRNAAAAGLGGVVVQAGDVLVLDLAAAVAAADAAGLFLWAREAG